MLIETEPIYKQKKKLRQFNCSDVNGVLSMLDVTDMEGRCDVERF